MSYNDIPLKPLKWYKELAGKEDRLESGAFLVEGERAIQQVIASHPEAILEILTTGEPVPAYRDYPVRQVTESQFSSISTTRTPQGIMAVVRLPAETYSSELSAPTGAKILILEDIQDPGNVGTLIRTAAAFDFAGAILAEKCADPFSPKVVQATAGSVLSLWLRRTSRYLELARELQQQGYCLVATDLRGDEDVSTLRENKVLLALGNEAAGLSPQLLKIADYRLRIPTAITKAESLNVAVCGGIAMYLTTAGANPR